jgi:hypothetical protein
MSSLSGVYGSSCARRGSSVSLGVRTRLFAAGDRGWGFSLGLRLGSTRQSDSQTPESDKLN